MRYFLAALGLLAGLNQAFGYGYHSPLPPGNYRETCHACTMIDDQLSCLCESFHHSYPIRLSGYIPDRCEYVERQHRSLVCTQEWHPHHQRHLRIAEFSAGPIWNNLDAQHKCNDVCMDQDGKWTGQWHTVVTGQDSVCQCRLWR